MESLFKRQERTKGIDMKKKWKRKGDNPSKSNISYHKKWRHNEPKQEKGRNLNKH
jgi:hypothetical protein